MSAEPDTVVALIDHPANGVALRVVELSAGYDSRPVIHGISISVSPGEVVSVVGPNGSGKSTLLKSIVGLVEIMSGKVFVGDEDVTGWPSENVARIGVGYVPQIDDVFGPLTVRENLEMGGYLLGARELPPGSTACSRCSRGSARCSAAAPASSRAASARCWRWAAR